MQLLPRPQRENQYPSHLEPEKVEKPRLLTVEKNNFPDENSKREITAGNRVAVFIDGANLFYAAMHLHIEVDYTKLLRCLAKERQLLRAYFYTAIDSTNDKQQGFILWMRRNGYRVVAKELIQFPDGSKKASLDVEIAVDMMTLAKHCDTLVLLSGDGDLAYAVNNVSYRGAQVEVVSLRSMTSDTLINVADCYTDLEYLKPEIQKT
jgi:uncharacterized LabA/DUF88 family protein